MKSRPLVIGLTGGIASGKSQVCRFFSELGVKIIDSDKIAKDLFKDGSKHLRKLKEKFGNSIFSPEGTLDRKSLGNIVFSNPDQLKWLNNFTHPLIYNEINQQLSSITLISSDYLILDIPLLIDSTGEVSSRFETIIDRILVINTSKENQLMRLQLRDGRTNEQALEIIHSQSSLEQKLNLADDIIDNNASIEELNIHVKSIHNQYVLLSQP